VAAIGVMLCESVEACSAKMHESVASVAEAMGRDPLEGLYDELTPDEARALGTNRLIGTVAGAQMKADGCIQLTFRASTACVGMDFSAAFRRTANA
jgi:hypothetical protein